MVMLSDDQSSSVLYNATFDVVSNTKLIDYFFNQIKV